MKQDEILQAAKKAGLLTRGNCYYAVCHQTEIERFAAIIEKRTIERCEEECEYVSKNARASTVLYAYKTGADDCVAAIRKLGEQE